MNIYIITAINFGYGNFPKSSRVWGWFDSSDKARKAVEENWSDIAEDGSYPYAVIEEVPEGVCMAMCIKEIAWYHWEEGKYLLSEKPTDYSGVIAFGIS